MTAGIWQQMETAGLKVPWTSDVMPAADLDMMYYGTHGDKITSPLVDKLLKDGVLSDEAVSRLAQLINHKYYQQWAKLYQLFTLEYDPVMNTDVTDEETVESTDEHTPNLETEHITLTERNLTETVTDTPGVTVEEQIDTTRKQTETVTETPNIQRSSETESERRQTEQTIVTPGVTEHESTTTTNGQTKTTTVTPPSQIVTETETSTPKQTVTEGQRVDTDQTKAFDGADMVDSGGSTKGEMVTETEYANPQTETKTVTQTGNETTEETYSGPADNVEIERSKEGSDTTTVSYSGQPDTVTVTENESGTSTRKTEYAGEPDTTTRTQTQTGSNTTKTAYEGDPDKVTDTVTETGTDTTKRNLKRTLRHFGNIGVNATADILIKEIGIWKDFTFWDMVMLTADMVLTAHCY